MNVATARGAGGQGAVAAAGLAWMVLLLLPVGRTAELPLLLGAVLGLGVLHRAARLPGSALLGVLALAYCGSAVLSAIDAVAPAKSWTTALGSLRFPLFAAFVLVVLHERMREWNALVLGVAALVALWVLDALVQSVSGHSLGGPMRADRVSGVFGADDLKLGPVLAVLAPFLLVAVRARYGRVGLGAVALLLGFAVLMAGARAAWVMYALVLAVFLWREVRRPLAFAALVGAAACAALLLGALAYRASPEFAERVHRTMAVVGGDRASVDHALAGRLPIWDTAWSMGLAHPVNGVGVRGFRHAYAAHARADDPWLQPYNGGAALHAHQWLLELWSETGLPGLLAWFAGIAAALRTWTRASIIARERAFAPGLALLAMLFPLNTHFAFYSSFWGLLLWWLLALFLAALAAPAETDRGA